MTKIENSEIKCDLCRFNNFAILFDKISDNSKILECLHCGLVFVHPQSVKRDLGSYYQGQSVASESDLKRFNKRLNHLNSALGKTILNEFYGYKKITEQKSNIIKKFFAFLLIPFFNKNIIPFRGEGRILDIGCSSGLYLSLLKSIGWEAYGVEVNRSACDYAGKMGIKVFCGELEKAGFEDKYFDVIRLTHVLEHVSSPSQVFTETKRIIKPSGIIYLDIPNQKSFAASCFKERWLGPGGHLYGFSAKTLKRLSEKFGFSVKRISFKSSKGIILSSLSYKFGRFLPSSLLRNKAFYVLIVKPLFGFFNLIGKGDTLAAEIVLR